MMAVNSSVRVGFLLKDPRRAFSLTELIVAAGVTVMLAAVMIGIASNVIGISSRATGSIQGNTQSTLAIDLLTRDLQALILRNTDDVWLAASVQPHQAGVGDPGGSLGSWDSIGGGTMKPGWTDPGTPDSSLNLNPISGNLEDYRFGMAGIWLRFFTSVIDENVGGIGDVSAPRAVGYQIVRHRVSNVAGASYRYGLFRSEVRPYDIPSKTSTFSSGYDIFSLAYCNRDDPDIDEGDPENLRRPTRSQLLAMNVIDFGIRVFEQNATGDLQLTFPVSSTDLCYAATRDNLAKQLPGATASNTDYNGFTVYGFPAIVEISVRVLSEEGAQLIEGLESGTDPGQSWWEIAEANSRVFSRRIVMKARPL